MLRREKILLYLEMNKIVIIFKPLIKYSCGIVEILILIGWSWNEIVTKY